MKKQTKFPDLSQVSTFALGKKTVEIDGQKVLFDEAVELQPNDQKD